MIRAALLALALLATACHSGGTSTKGDVLVVVSAPLTAQPWIGRFAERGAKLAAGSVIASGRPDAVRTDAAVQRAYLGQP